MKFFNLGATYEREIEGKPINNVLFNSGLAMIIIALTFIAGIRPVSVALAQNQKYKSELNSIKKNMIKKISQIDVESTAIIKSQEGVTLLFEAIPNEILLQDFLEDLVITAAKSGFLVQQMRPIETESSALPLDVRFSGNIEDLPKLVKAIENSMPRFVSIEEVITQRGEHVSSVRMKLIIYTL
jgi:Tfp pilus assembly protein PilO